MADITNSSVPFISICELRGDLNSPVDSNSCNTLYSLPGNSRYFFHCLWYTGVSVVICQSLLHIPKDNIFTRIIIFPLEMFLLGRSSKIISLRNYVHVVAYHLSQLHTDHSPSALKHINPTTVRLLDLKNSYFNARNSNSTWTAIGANSSVRSPQENLQYFIAICPVCAYVHSIVESCVVLKGRTVRARLQSA